MRMFLRSSILSLMVAGLVAIAAAQSGSATSSGQTGTGQPGSSGQAGNDGSVTSGAGQMGSGTGQNGSGQMGANHMGSNKMGSGLSSADQKFVKEAAQGGLAEVELGQLAVQKASSDDVKKFGQRMVDDHSKANDKLKEVASNKGITLPQEPNAKQKATKARLEKLSGDQFDKAYMKDMLQDHKKDVAAFQNESSMGKDSDIKNFASQTLPTLQDHLKDAQTITPKVTQAMSTGMQSK